MKNLFLLMASFFGFFSYAQTERLNVGLSKLTEIMIAKNYSLAERQELQKHPSKLQELDYIYSRSFAIENQSEANPGLIEKIDITRYDLVRKVDQEVKVIDESSGLTLTLFSLNKMNADRAKFSQSTKRDPAGKIAE